MLTSLVQDMDLDLSLMMAFTKDKIYHSSVKLKNKQNYFRDKPRDESLSKPIVYYVHNTTPGPPPAP